MMRAQHKRILLTLLVAFSGLFFLSKSHEPMVKASICFLWFDDEFLIVKNSRGHFKSHWGMPGGKAEPGESVAETVQREIYEETGLEIPLKDYKYRRSFVMNKVIDMAVFEYTFDQRPEVKLNPDEHSDYKWVKMNEALEYKFIPGDVDVVAALYGKNY